MVGRRIHYQNKYFLKQIFTKFNQTAEQQLLGNEVMKDFIEQPKEKALQDFKTQFYSGEIDCQKMQRQSRFFSPLSRCIDFPASKFLDNSQTATQYSPCVKTVYPFSISNENRRILPLSHSIPLQDHQETKLKEEIQVLKFLDMKLPSQDQNKLDIHKRCRLPTLPTKTSLQLKQHVMKTETKSSSPTPNMMSQSKFEPFNFHPYSEVIQTNKIINSPSNITKKEPHSVGGSSQEKRTNHRLSASEKRGLGNQRDFISSEIIVATNSTSSSKTSLQASLSPQNSTKQTMSCFTPKKTNKIPQLNSPSLDLKTNNQPTKQEKKSQIITEIGSPKKLESIVLKFTEIKSSQNHIFKFENLNSNYKKIHGKKLILTRKVAKISVKKQRHISDIVTIPKIHTKDPLSLQNSNSNSNGLHDYSKEIDEDVNCQYEQLSNYYDAKYRQTASLIREEGIKGSQRIHNEAHQPNQILFNEFLPWNEIENKHAASSSKERFNFKSYKSELV